MIYSEHVSSTEGRVKRKPGTCTVVLSFSIIGSIFVLQYTLTTLVGVQFTTPYYVVSCVASLQIAMFQVKV